MNFDDDSNWISIPYIALEQRLEQAWGLRAGTKWRRPPTQLRTVRRPRVRRPRTKTRRIGSARDPR